MNNHKTFELIPVSQKSFYGKARVIEENGCKTLISYSTPVIQITKAGNIRRLWSGYSATTMKHVNDFLRYYGYNVGGKKWWINEEVHKFDSYEN